MDYYESDDGEVIEFNHRGCLATADSVMEDLLDAHQEEGGDFWITSSMVIQNILDVLQSRCGMDDDDTMDYILEFIKKGEEH